MLFFLNNKTEIFQAVLPSGVGWWGEVCPVIILRQKPRWSCKMAGLCHPKKKGRFTERWSWCWGLLVIAYQHSASFLIGPPPSPLTPFCFLLWLAEFNQYHQCCHEIGALQGSLAGSLVVGYKLKIIHPLPPVPIGYSIPRAPVHSGLGIGPVLCRCIAGSHSCGESMSVLAVSCKRQHFIALPTLSSIYILSGFLL